MKLFSILLSLLFIAAPLQASKILEVFLNNATDEDVIVKSFHLKNAKLLLSTHEEGEVIKPTKLFQYYVEHPVEDFKEKRKKGWNLSEEDNYVTLQINEIEFPLFWKTYIWPRRSLHKGFQFYCSGGDHKNFETFFSGGGGTSPFSDEKGYIACYTFGGCLRKIQ